MYDLLIVGGGPGGVAAGVYAARKKIKTILVTDTFGGQSFVSADVQNWIGTKSVSGFDLARMLEEHLRAQEGIEIADGDLVIKINKTADGFLAETQNGKKIETRYILLASGSRRRKLGVPGEKELDGKGVAYCSICDAPLFKDKTVAVIGGGNAGLEAVIDLLPYANRIYLLERGPELKGDPVTQERIKKENKVETIFGVETREIKGKNFVEGMVYAGADGGTKELKLDGVFVEVGAIPNSDLAKGLLELNKFGEVAADPRSQQTSDPGIWAIGDVTDVRFKQNNISAGDAVKAILYINEKVNGSATA